MRGRRNIIIFTTTRNDQEDASYYYSLYIIVIVYPNWNCIQSAAGPLSVVDWTGLEGLMIS